LIFVFGDCELDLDRFELRRAGQVRPVEPQVFDLLAVLIRERRRVVPKAELLDTVWGSRFVSESALTSRVKAARQAIGDDGRSQHLIRTAHGRRSRTAAWSRSTAATTCCLSAIPLGSTSWPRSTDSCPAATAAPCRWSMNSPSLPAM
jgi:hypothetical protein